MPCPPPNFDAVYLSDPGYWKLVVPWETKNYVTEPSAEYSSSGSWVGMTNAVTRQGGMGYKGAFGWTYTPAAGAYDGCYTSVTLPTGKFYFSVQFNCATAGNNYRIYWAQGNSNPIIGTSYTFTTRQGWLKDRVSSAYTVTVAGTFRLYITKANSANLNPFFFDCVQCEPTYQTTYFDGDTPGAAWTGQPGASVSWIGQNVRDHGFLLNLQSTEWAIEQWAGAGMPPVQNVMMKYGLLEGGMLQRSKAEARVLTLTSNLNVSDSNSLASLHLTRQKLIDALKPDITDPDHPQNQRIYYTGSGVDGNYVYLKGVYDSGLEMNYAAKMGFTEKIGLSFMCPDPYVYEDIEDNTWTETTYPAANKFGVVRLYDSQNATNQWLYDDLGGGVGTAGNARVYCALMGNDGKLYVGGQFTTAGGVGGNRIYLARYNFATSAWETVAAGGAANGAVYCFHEGPDGTIYIGGAFTSINGNATKRFCSYNPKTTTWRYFATGPDDGAVWALAYTTLNLLFVGGDFTDVAGVEQPGLALYNLTTSVYDAIQPVYISTGGIAPGDVYGIAVDPSNGIDVYLCGHYEYHEMGGSGLFTQGATHIIFNYTYSPGFYTFTLEGCGSGFEITAAYFPVDCDFGADGLIYFAGSFHKLGDGTTDCWRAAKYGGVEIEQLGPGLENGGSLDDWAEIAGKDLDGYLYFRSRGTYSAAGTDPTAYINSPSYILKWTGTNFLPFEYFGDAAIPSRVLIHPVQGVFIFSGTTSAMTITPPALLNGYYSGSANSWPRFYLVNNRAVTPKPLYLTSIVNLDTGDTMYFNMQVFAPGDTITIDTTPGQPKVYSQYFGELAGALMGGSHINTMQITPRQPALGFPNYYNIAFTFSAQVNWALGIGVAAPRTHWAIDGGRVTGG